MVKFKLKHPITIDNLEEIGFVNITPRGMRWLTFTHYSGVIIQSDEFINGGGFHFNSMPINSMEEVLLIIDEYKKLANKIVDSRSI